MSAWDTRGIMASNGELITPSDTVAHCLEGGFLIDAQSTINFTFMKNDKKPGNTVSWVFPAGYHPIKIYRIKSTGTTLGGSLLGFNA
jgi:hypothetical protein